MSELTMDRLAEIMRTAAGDEDTAKAQREIDDVPFADLGFDSLALLETVALIKRENGVKLADDELTDLKTPRELLDRVNAELARA